MLQLQNLSYGFSGSELLYSNLNISIDTGLHGLIGNNGSGKSTLLRLIHGELIPTGGGIETNQAPYYIPQLNGQWGTKTVAEVLGVASQLEALTSILSGDTEAKHFETLNDWWDLEEDIQTAFRYWGLSEIPLQQHFTSLSGGMQTRALLGGLSLHHPKLILLDEPTNHLDGIGRKLLYQFLSEFKGTALIVSHDRTLLNHMDSILHLQRKAITRYGGNYDFYVRQKQIQNEAINQQYTTQQNLLKSAEKQKRLSAQRKQKQDLRGKAKQQKAGLPTILQHSLQNKAQISSSKLMQKHQDKIEDLKDTVLQLRQQATIEPSMQFDLIENPMPSGKLLIEASSLNFQYPNTQKDVWKEQLNISIFSGEKWQLVGNNGSGKSTFMHLINSVIMPSKGSLILKTKNIFYLDQHYDLIEEDLTIFNQAMKFKHSKILPQDIGRRLTHFLFSPADWEKPCHQLSGGERMRLALCCLSILNTPIDILLLDEPTNNLDLESLSVLTEVLKSYKGTLIVTSHDPIFIKEIGIEKAISLDTGGAVKYLDTFRQ